jgi:hypothetical protein
MSYNCADAPVWVQLKILFQKGYFGGVLGEARSPVTKGGYLFLMTWLGYVL